MLMFIILYQLDTVEMWLWKRMIRIPWSVKMTSIEVMEEQGQTRLLVNRIWRG